MFMTFSRAPKTDDELSLQMRVIETTEVERLVAKVEKLSAKSENGSRDDSPAPSFRPDDLPSHLRPSGESH
jgi:hypothetical protein